MRIVFGQSMAGTGNKVEELRHRIEEIQDLRQEEQKHRFAEMSQDAHNGKRHSGEIVKRVPHKYLRWVSGSSLRINKRNS